MVKVHDHGDGCGDSNGGCDVVKVRDDCDDRGGDYVDDHGHVAPKDVQTYVTPYETP